jgi:hypothetical protein
VPVRAKTICGLVTTRDVLRFAPQIARDFGPGTLLRCCVAVAKRKKTTFLQCAFPPKRGGKLGGVALHRRARRLH